MSVKQHIFWMAERREHVWNNDKGNLCQSKQRESTLCDKMWMIYCTFMVFCSQDDVLCSRWGEDVGPFIGIKELSSKVWCKVFILEVWSIIPLHEVNIRLQFQLLPVPPRTENKEKSGRQSFNPSFNGWKINKYNKIIPYFRLYV